MSSKGVTSRSLLTAAVVVAGSLTIGFSAAGLSATASATPESSAAAVKRYWTPERRATAIPRDFVVDSRGLTYIEQLDGTWRPHGHSVPAAAGMGTPMAKPGGSTDSTPPSVSNQSPAAGATIGSSQTFSATVTDASGVKSVSFRIIRSDGATQTISAIRSGDIWSASLGGLTDGSWTWLVIATDNVSRGGNTTTTTAISFTVDTAGGGGGGGGGGGDIVVNQRWTAGGPVLTAAGRIYFEMPTSKRLTRWAGYVCSGTVATDGTTGRSIIITAAHCVYDDVNKAFARNVMFIPNQDGTTGTGTDRNCLNDPLGCWTTSFGVVDVNWANRSWPSNIPWDYAYYVVSDGTSNKLDEVAGSLPVSFSVPSVGTYTHALGYSYASDPFFMYCAENLDVVDASNWWLGSCGLSGGSSGGPWIQPMNAGSGPIVSVNSWGYSGSPGMAGPKLSGTSASCLFDRAKSASINTQNGISVNNC